MSTESVIIEDELSITLIKGKRTNKRKLLEIFNLKKNKRKNHAK